MRVTVMTVAGGKQELEVEGNMTMRVIKEMLQARTSIAPDQQVLLKGGKPLINDSTVDDASLKDGDVIHMVLNIVGGK